MDQDTHTHANNKRCAYVRCIGNRNNIATTGERGGGWGVGGGIQSSGATINMPSLSVMRRSHNPFRIPLCAVLAYVAGVPRFAFCFV